MSTARTKIRAARSAYAVFSTTDMQTGEVSYFRQAVQFWQQREDGSWAGMIVNERGLADAQRFTNFVNFRPVRTGTYPG